MTSRPPALTEPELGALKDQLIGERARTEQQLTMLRRTFDELVEAADLEPPDDEHDPDGTTAYERAQVTSLAGVARLHWERLNKALTAIDAGGYGLCERCRRPIGFARLHALPATTRCVSCACR